MRKLIALFLVLMVSALAITPLMFKAYSIINAEMSCCEKSCSANHEKDYQSNTHKDKACQDDFCCPISCSRSGGNIFMALYKDKDVNLAMVPSFSWNKLSPITILVKSNYSSDCFHPPEMV